MEVANDHNNITRDIFALLARGYSKQQVEAELLNKGHEELFVKELLQETIKLRNAKKRVLGLSLILAGALVCLLSCVLAITLHMSASHFSLVLYGCTSLGIILVFAGFTQVF